MITLDYQVQWYHYEVIPLPDQSPEFRSLCPQLTSKLITKFEDRKDRYQCV